MNSSPDPRDMMPERNVQPIVPLPRARLTATGIAMGCGILGVGLFLVLDSNRRAPAAQPIGPAQATIASPPSLDLPRPAPELASAQSALPSSPTASTPPPSAPIYQSQPIYAPMAASYDPPPVAIPATSVMAKPGSTGSASTEDAVLLMDISPGDARVTNAAPPAPPAAASGEQPTADEQAVRASVIRSRSSLVSQGTLIAAVLETPIHSSRPGLARAIVSKNVRGFDGTRILIPRGSRLIGEAQGGTQAGQKRVLVNWTRLIRPDGVAIRIGSPAADQLGGAGIKGSVNNYFLGRFGNAVLQTVLQIGINRASRTAMDSVVLSVPGQLEGTVSQVPIFNVPAGPSISISQGTEISIFVAKDLDFGGTGGRR